MKINYLTSNPLKFKIAERYFENIGGYELVQHSFKVPETQDDSCESIARESATYAAKELDEPCVAMDAGFYIEALNGFPGPFVKYINQWLNEEQILKMVDKTDSRSAYFIDALAIGFPDGSAQVFSHKTYGKLANVGEYQASDWPVNSLFIPNGYSKPLGSMSDDEQVEFWSHENQNWEELVEFLTKK